MSDQYIGEIRIFGCNFAPVGWAQCNGQTLAIRQNTALFSLLGVSYGGDGQNTFALPNLQGRAAVCKGQGTGLSKYDPGSVGGASTVALLPNQMPAHNHSAIGAATSDNANPANLTWGNADFLPAPNYFSSTPGTLQVMSPQALGLSGSGLPHNNLMPYQVLNFCIALQGEFPQRP